MATRGNERSSRRIAAGSKAAPATKPKKSSTKSKKSAEKPKKKDSAAPIAHPEAGATSSPGQGTRARKTGTTALIPSELASRAQADSPNAASGDKAQAPRSRGVTGRKKQDPGQQASSLPPAPAVSGDFASRKAAASDARNGAQYQQTELPFASEPSKASKPAATSTSQATRLAPKAPDSAPRNADREPERFNESALSPASEPGVPTESPEDLPHRKKQRPFPPAPPRGQERFRERRRARSTRPPQAPHGDRLLNLPTEKYWDPSELLGPPPTHEEPPLPSLGLPPAGAASMSMDIAPDNLSSRRGLSGPGTYSRADETDLSEAREERWSPGMPDSDPPAMRGQRQRLPEIVEKETTAYDPLPPVYQPDELESLYAPPLPADSPHQEDDTLYPRFPEEIQHKTVARRNVPIPRQGDDRHPRSLRAGRRGREERPPRERYPQIPVGPAGLTYLIDGTSHIGAVGTLRIFYRLPTHDGRHGAAVQPVLIDRQLPRRSRDPIDHQISSALLRLPRQHHPRHGKQTKSWQGKQGRRQGRPDPFAITIPEKAWRTILPWLFETGRGYVFPEEGKEAAPLTRDGGPPLEFNLLIERIPKRGDYHLTSRFVRAGKTLLYKSQVLLITEGESGFLIRRSGRMSVVNFAGGASWLRALRRGRFRHVPRKKIPTLLRIFERSTTLPPIHFPGQLKIARIEGLAPRPELKLESGPQEVAAEVAFRYGEDLVRAARPGSRFFSMRNRRLIVRNLDAEAAHAINLLKQGFLYDPKTHLFSLSADRLASAAPELFELGWTLHGKKMPFRPPTDMEVSVETGPDYIDVSVIVHFGDQTVDLVALLDAMKQGNRMIPLQQGTVGVLPGEWLEKNAAWMELGQL